MKGNGTESLSVEQTRFVRSRRRQRVRLFAILVIAVGIILGSVMPRIDAHPTVPTFRAGNILTAVGFGILGLVTVLYSLLFLVVQSSNTTFTPASTSSRTIRGSGGRTPSPWACSPS